MREQPPRVAFRAGSLGAMIEPSPAIVSVVTAPRVSRARVQPLLEALAQQTVGAAAIEVIVVGEVPADPVPEALALQIVPLGEDGGTAARNRGWRAAGGAMVAFLDDDCEPQPDWIERLLEAAAGRHDVIIQGRTLADPREAQSAGPFTVPREVTREQLHYPASNLLYTRALLERLDGFDERHGTAAGAEADLAWRARAAGATVEYAPDALVHHGVEPRALADAIQDALGAADRVKLYGDHPELRAALDKRLFLNPTHFVFAQAAFGALLATRKPAALLFTVPYAAHVFRRAQAAGNPAATPLLVAQDAVEFAATIAGAIRHRTPVL